MYIRQTKIGTCYNVDLEQGVKASLLVACLSKCLGVSAGSACHSHEETISSVLQVVTRTGVVLALKRVENCVTMITRKRPKTKLTVVFMGAGNVDPGRVCSRHPSYLVWKVYRVLAFLYSSYIHISI